jgi:hypothetical protein
VVDNCVEVDAEGAGQPLLGQLGHRSGIHRCSDFTCYPICARIATTAFVEHQFAQLVSSLGPALGQDAIGSGLGEQDSAAARISGTEFQDRPDAGSEP